MLQIYFFIFTWICKIATKIVTLLTEWMLRYQCNSPPRTHKTVRQWGSHNFWTISSHVAVRPVQCSGRHMPKGILIAFLSCWRLRLLYDHNKAGSIRQIEKIYNNIETRTHYLSACSLVPKPTTLSRVLQTWTKVWLKNGVFQDVTPSGSYKNRRFGGT
jgi:hypothetical protein